MVHRSVWRRRVVVGCVLCGWILPPAAVAARRPRDAWISRIALDELHRTVETAKYEELSRRIQEVTLERLACGDFERFGTLNDMVYVLRGCKYLPVVEKLPKGRTMVKWLVENPDLTRRLFRGLEDVADVQAAMTSLRELLDADVRAVRAYPDLAVAFATSVPSPIFLEKQLHKASVSESFLWYANSRMPFRYDLKAMPFELSRYVADTRMSIAERQWVWKKYRRKLTPSETYYDVDYDYGHLMRGVPKKIESLDFTLPNLKEVGGVCIEQAYYSAQVCKAMGIPAAVATGRGHTGVFHAWLASLEIKGRGKNVRAAWNTDTGRYEIHLFYSGKVHNPATGRYMQDLEMVLNGAAAQLPLFRREEADSAVALARLAAANQGAAVKGCPALKKLAALHDARLVPSGKETKNQKDQKDAKDAKKTTRRRSAPPAQLDWAQEEGTIDMALVEKLIDLGIRRNLVHRPAWELIIELRKDSRMPVKNLDAFFEVLIKRTAQEYPDYSCDLVLRIVQTIEEADIRAKVCQRAARIYGRRPDLRGRILLSLAADYRRQDKQGEALQVYEQTILGSGNVPGIVLAATKEAEGLLKDNDQGDLVVQMYEKLFQKAPHRKIARRFQKYTLRYLLGERLIAALIDVGRAGDAEKIREMIEQSPGRKRRRRRSLRHRTR